MKPLRIIQFSDLHLFKSSSGRLLNVNTSQSFEKVLASARKDCASADMVLVTGDISQDGSIVSYRRAAQALKKLKKPVYCLPGNHDMKPAMKQGLRAPNVFLTRHIVHGRWNILFLDSTIPRSHTGNLRSSELAFLKKSLKRFPHHHALVCFHHSPFKLGSEWLDRMKIKNAKAFLKVVDKRKNVCGVVFGHVHQTVYRKRKGIVYSGAPSICIQFKPNSPGFKLDGSAPGYQIIQLEANGNVTARVRRLRHSPFKPDLSSRGY